jgi:hypothetical protein
MLNKFKNRKKGVAIEISIIALVVVFAISTLLVSISIMANAIGKNALSDQKEKTQLAQVAKIAISYINNNATLDGYEITNNQNNTYTIVSDEGDTYTIKSDENDNSIKILTKQNGNIKLKFSFTETKTITSWVYTTN